MENAVVNLEDDAPVKPEPNHVDAEVIESSSSAIQVVMIFVACQNFLNLLVHLRGL